MIRLVLLALFVLSGAAGLVYEVAWTRRLVLVLGNSTHAVALILAAFMLGLALGSWLFGRRADRLRRPVLVYGLLEAGIGVYALVFPFLLDLVTTIYVSLGPATGTSYAVKFVLAFLLLVIPSTLMGGTLPVIVRWAVDRLEVVGGRVGAFYGANTFGAVLGCFLAGYVLIERLGVTGATRVAAYLNLAVAVAALLLGRFVTGARSATATEGEAAAAGDPIEAGLVRTTAAAFFVSGFCALALEVLWTKMLVFFLQGFTWTFTAMLTTFLLGLAAGAAVLGQVVNRVRNPVRFLGGLLLAIAFASAVAQILLVNLFGVWDGIRDLVVVSWGVPYKFALFGGALVVMIVPTFLMGGVFPAVSRIVSRGLDAVGRSVGWVYALNTIGAVLGSLAAGLVLVPLIGMRWAVVAVVLLLGAVGGRLLVASRERTVARQGLVFVLITVLVLVLLQTQPDQPFIERSHVFQGPMGSSRKLIDYREGTICAVSVVEDEVTGFRTLYTDEFAAAATGDHYRYMRMLGHLPLMLSPERKDVLVIAFGTGTTAGSVAVHEGVERLDVVEISPEVFEVAHLFADVNKNVMDRPAPPIVTPYVMDGRNFTLTTDRRYDVITLEPLMPYTPAAVNLYTKEFYEICREALKPGGVMCQWIPIHAMTVDDYKMLARSFVDVFPESSVWFFETTSAIIGHTEPGPMRYRRLADRAAETGVAADLREIGLEDPDAVLSCFVTGGEDLRAFLDGVEPMTDEHPTMEYHPVAYGGVNSFFAANLGTFYLERRPVAERLDLGGVAGDVEAIRRELAARYERGQDFLAARNNHEMWKYWAIQGQHGRAAPHLTKAVEAYNAAIARAPDLPDANLEAYRTGAVYHLLVSRALGHLNLGQRAEAIDLLRRAAALDPPDKPHQAFFLLGRTLREEGRVSEAETALRRAVELHPGQAEYRAELERCLETRHEVPDSAIAEAARLVRAIRGGTVRGSELRELLDLRARHPALPERLAGDVGAIVARVLDVEGADWSTRDRHLKLLVVLAPADLQATLARVVAEPRQGPDLRGLAARSAARRAGHEHLFERLRDGDEETRALVARTLGAVRAPDAVRPLVDVLADESREVRMQAYLALFGITNREFGYDPDAPPEKRAQAIARWRSHLEASGD